MPLLPWYLSTYVKFLSADDHNGPMDMKGYSWSMAWLCEPANEEMSLLYIADDLDLPEERKLPFYGDQLTRVRLQGG